MLITYLRELTEANGYELTEKKEEPKNVYPRIWSFKCSHNGSLLKLHEDGLYYNYNNTACFTLDNMLHHGRCVDNGEFIINQVRRGSHYS